MNQPVTDTPAQRIAVLGIGMMGEPMARRLCAAGHHVSVWNRTRNKAERLCMHGARVAATAADAVRDAHLVITLLLNGDAVADVLFAQGVAAACRPGTLVLDMSTILPAQARDHATGAGSGHAGRPARNRSTGQLANQMIVGITIGAVAEALLLCQKGGAEMAQVRQAISGGFADSRILQVHGQRMVERDIAKRGSMAVQLKDLRNALNTAKEQDFQASSLPCLSSSTPAAWHTAWPNTTSLPCSKNWLSATGWHQQKRANRIGPPFLTTLVSRAYLLKRPLPPPLGLPPCGRGPRRSTERLSLAKPKRAPSPGGRLPRP